MTKKQAQFSIDSLLPSPNDVQMVKVRAAFTKVLNYAEPNTVDLLKAGANPNGTINTTAAVLAAFAQGKKVYVPKGTYLVSAPIEITNNVECELGAKFIVANGYKGDVFVIKSRKNLLINGLHIVASGLNVKATGLKINGLWDSKISGYSFVAGLGDTTSIGIDIYSSDPATMVANPFGTYVLIIDNAHCTRGRYGIRSQKTVGDKVDITHLNIYSGWFSSQTNENILLNNTYNFNIINPAFDNITNTGLKLVNCHQGFFRLGEYNSGVAMNVNDNCSLIDFETALPLLAGMVVGTNYTAKTADRVRLKPTTGEDYYTEYRSLNSYSEPFSIVGKPGGGNEIKYLSYQAEVGLKPHTLNPESTGSNMIGINSAGGLVKVSARKMTQGKAAPTTGTWAKGDYCENYDPDAGEYFGWVCVVAGSPGVWKGYGLIQN